jgi:hypothetical protein
MKKELLLMQFDACFDRNGWFVAVRNAVDGVTAEQAAWRLEGITGQIVLLRKLQNAWNPEKGVS